jgi:hypothetical protein
MKKEQLRSASQPKPLPIRHQFEHQQPTQIHDPEENMMVLARWTHRAMKKPSLFWGSIIGIVVGVLGIVLLSNVFLASGSTRGDIWIKLEQAKSPGDRVQIADDNPGSPVASWARLQAASEYYNQGFADLPNNRDVALPVLKKALDLYDKVLKEVPNDSPQAKTAALGKARALEARNELEKAVEQYRQIVKTWPGSAEAETAKELASALEMPGAAAFYKDLYAYSPSKVTLPPLGTQNLNLPLAPAPGALNAEANPGGLLPSIPLLPPPPPLPVTKEAAGLGKSDAANKSSSPGLSEKSKSTNALPASPFASPSSSTTTKSVSGATPKIESPKNEPKPTGAGTEKKKP